LRKSQPAILARLDFTTHSPYIRVKKAFLPSLGVMVAIQ